MNGASARGQALGRQADREIVLDPTLCSAHGMCADVMPEVFELDEWGYPVLISGGLRTPVPDELVWAAKRAVRSCPVRALAMHRLDQSAIGARP